MDSGSVLSEPVHYPHTRGFPKERSVSMTIISPKTGQPRMSQLENLEAKMANIEVSLSSVNGGRRRKGTSLGGGTISARSSPRPPPTPQPIESKELRTALQDREAVIQNLRNVLCLGKLPRPTGPPLDDTERPAAEQKLQRLKIESENKKIAIRNLKSALDKLDITDNIDIRIRQAELEYALGREELQLLSIVEEVRALQTRLDKSKPESNSIYNILTSGVNLCLHAVQATTGRWAANTKSDSLGLFIEWALDGEGLYRGDRILEINGKLITCRTKDELQKLIGTIGKCQLVVIRKKSSAIQHQQLAQQQEDNQRLQHRISYLEEQVCELLQTQIITKETTPPSPPPPLKLQNNQQRISPINNNGNNCGNGLSGHVTSISISSASSSPSDKPEIFQRGNYVTTLVGGKPIELTGNNNSTAIKNTTNSKSNNIITPNNNNSKSHITKTIIKENGNHTDGENNNNNYAISKSLSASKISINSDLLLSSSNHKRRAADRAARNHNKLHSESTNHQYQQLNSQGIYHNGSGGHHHRNNNNNMHARSVEHLNYNGVDRRSTSKFDVLRNNNEQIRKFGNDLRSVKSLDFESDNDNHQYHNHHHHHNGHHHNGHIKQQNGHSNNHHNHNHYNNYNDQQKFNTDYTSEPVAPRIRPTPPKKPLRLSLQRAQSLQTVELLPSDAEKKRSLKRLHHSDKSKHENALIENCSPLLTASLGRHKHI